MCLAIERFDANKEEVALSLRADLKHNRDLQLSKAVRFNLVTAYSPDISERGSGI